MATMNSPAGASASPPARGARGWSRRRWVGVGFGGLALGLGGWWWSGGMPGVMARAVGVIGERGSLYTVEPQDLSITLMEDGEVKPLRSIELKNEVEGETTIRFIVDESTRVRKGDLLVELASDKLIERLESEQIELEQLEGELHYARSELDIQLNQNASELRQAEIDVLLAEKELEKYLEGEYRKALQAIEIDREETSLQLDRMRDELKKNRELLEREFVTQSKVDQTEREVKTLELRLEQHALSLEILNSYERPITEQRLRTAIDQARDALERTRARAEAREAQARTNVQRYEGLVGLRRERFKRMQEQLAKCRILAPVDGIVQYPSNDRWGNDDSLKVGSQVREGQTLVVLPDTSSMIVTARVHEADRHKLREDMQCLVRVPAVPGAAFTGRLSKIAKFADSANRWLNPDLKEHEAEIRLDPTDAPLSPGDSAQVEILVDYIRETLAVPVQCVYTRGRSRFVFVEQRGGAVPIQVELGASNSAMTQVLSGLRAGDRVRLNPGPALLALLPSPQQEEQAAFNVEQSADRPAEAAAAAPQRVARQDGDEDRPAAPAVKRPEGETTADPVPAQHSGS